MVDQASSLRLLKQKIDNEKLSEFTSPEEFLNQIKRPASFTSIAIIVPEQFESYFPPAKKWLSAIAKYSKSACLWDQGLIFEDKEKQIDEKKNIIKEMIKISQIPVQIQTLPRRDDINFATKLSDIRKYQLVDAVSKGLRNFSEVWISIKASEFKQCMPILQATDIACIMVPEHQDATLKCYETVKSLHLSGYFSPITMLDFVSDNYSQQNLASEQIKKVAKQFLSLDLVSAGVVLSDNTYVLPESNNSLQSALTTIEPSSKDFLYSMAENLIYTLPGTY